MVKIIDPGKGARNQRSNNYKNELFQEHKSSTGVYFQNGIRRPPAFGNRYLCHYCQKVLKGKTGLVYDSDIEPVSPDEVEDFNNLFGYVNAGEDAFHQTIRIVLNGGLGTRMGLTGMKSLLEVKNGNHF
jgi:UDP-N-acetylglucosamine pyrophosphorylase